MWPLKKGEGISENLGRGVNIGNTQKQTKGKRLGEALKALALASLKECWKTLAFPGGSSWRKPREHFRVFSVFKGEM